MSDQDPFKENSDDTNPFADQLKVIVGNDGNPKYDSVEKALQALQHSQEHIQRLEAERKADEDEKNKLREELTKLGTVDDFVSRLKESNPDNKEPRPKETPEHSGLKEEDILNLIEKRYSERENEKQRRANRDMVVNKLKEAYKEKAGEVWNKMAEDLGVNSEKLLGLAQESPKVVLSLFGEIKNTNSSTTTSSIHIPPKINDGPAPIEPPKKSLLAGASMKEQAEFMRKIRDKVYSEYGVETK